MKYFRFLFVLLASLVLAACGTLGGGGTTAPAADKTDAMKAPGPKLEIRVLSFAWDPANQLLHGLDRPWATQAERQDRAQNLAPRLWEAYRADKVKAAQPRSYSLSVWGAKNLVPIGSIRVNGKNVVTPAPFTVTDATGKHPYAKLLREGKEFGKPDKVFVIKTDGPDAVGAGLQFDWSAVGPDTWVLICAEDARSVYPPQTEGSDVRDGLWLTPKNFTFWRDQQVTRVLTSFFAKD